MCRCWAAQSKNLRRSRRRLLLLLLDAGPVAALGRAEGWGLWARVLRTSSSERRKPSEERAESSSGPSGEEERTV